MIIFINYILCDNIIQNRDDYLLFLLTKQYLITSISSQFSFSYNLSLVKNNIYSRIW